MNICFNINDIVYGVKFDNDKCNDLMSKPYNGAPLKKFNYVENTDSFIIEYKIEIKYVLSNINVIPDNLLNFLDFISTIPTDYIDNNVQVNIVNALKSMYNTKLWDDLSTKEDIESYKFKTMNFIFKDAKKNELKGIPNIEDYTGVYPGTDAAAIWKRYYYARKKGHNVQRPEYEKPNNNVNKHIKNHLKNKAKVVKGLDSSSSSKSDSESESESDSESDSDSYSRKRNKKAKQAEKELQAKKVAKKASNSSGNGASNSSSNGASKSSGNGANNGANKPEEKRENPILAPENIMPAKNYMEFIQNETNLHAFKHVSYYDKQQLLFNREDTLYIFNCLYSKNMFNALKTLIELLGTNNSYCDNLIYVVNNMPEKYVENNRDMINHYLYYAFIILNKEVQHTKTSINKSSRTMFKLEDVCNLPSFKEIPTHHRCYIPFIHDDISENNLFMYIGNDTPKGSAVNKGYSIASLNEFKKRLSIYTKNIFEGFDFKSNNMYLVGSTMLAAAGINPLENKYSSYEDYINAVYYESDIDVAYCGDDDADFHANALKLYNHIKLIIPESRFNTIDRKFEVKYEIDMGFKTLDLFKANTAVGTLITKFHLNCVRSYYDGSDVYLTTECISALKTGINTSNRVFFNNTNPMNLVIRYARKGYTTVFNVKQRHNILKYINNSNWKDAFKSIVDSNKVVPKPAEAKLTTEDEVISFVRSDKRKETITDLNNDNDIIIKINHIFGSFSISHEFFNSDIHDMKKDKYPTTDYFTKQTSVSLDKPSYVNKNIIAEDNIIIPVDKKHYKPKWNDKNYVLIPF